MSVDILGSTQCSISLLLYSALPKQAFVLTLAYGPSRFNEKRHFWEYMDGLALSISEPWLFISDFNSVSDQSEKRGGVTFACSSKSGLRQFIDGHGLIDLGFKGNPFTWDNKRVDSANIRERLDRGVTNPLWRVMFPNASVLHTPALVSDHLPLIINTEGQGPVSSRPFKFQAMWLREPGCLFTVARAWELVVDGSPARVLLQKIALVKKSLRQWNKQYFGFVKENISFLTSELDKVQRLFPSFANTALEASLRADIQEQLIREQLLWQQRSRIEWLVSKDLNTKFFHLSTVIRRNRNSIQSLQLNSNL